MNKFQQSSSDDHKMSVPGGGVGPRSEVWEKETRSDVRGVGGNYHVTCPMMHVMYPPTHP